ncbi:MAG: type II secretion system protein, partial [Phycisphaerales bacterium JB059]
MGSGPEITQTTMSFGAFHHRVCGLAPAFVVVVIGASGVLKLADTPAFFETLGGWTVIPSQLRPGVVFGVPAMEVGVAAAWLLGWRGVAQAGAAALLILFSAAYLLQLSVAKPARCGRLGVLARYSDTLDEIRLLLFRNAALLLLLATPRVVSGIRSPAPIGGRKSQRGRGAHRRGFTLVEMVLSVAIIVLLTALLLPSLSGVRRRAWDTKSISNLRQHSLVFGAYASDHAGYFPFFTDPDATWTVLRAGEESVVVPYFGASPYWKYALAP